MKKILVAVLVLIALVGCSDNSTPSKKGSNESASASSKEVSAVSTTQKEIKVDDVISVFKDAGLEAENPRKMTKDDFGMGPMKSNEAKLIILPSICVDCSGRILSYKNKEDLKQMKKYYDDLGKESAMLFSWTLEKDNILVQFNGDLPEEKYNLYKKSLDSIE
jgi:hypothetical protein